MTILRNMKPLVEPRTFRHMCAIRSKIEKKNNGENLVRVILIVVVLFLLLQAMYHTRELAENDNPQKAGVHAFLPSPIGTRAL